MDWPRIKSVLIVLFLIINIVLICAIFYNEHEKSLVKEENVADAVAVLQKNGVTMEDNLISRQKDVWCSYEIELGMEEKNNIAQDLLQGELQEQTSADNITTTYQGEQGALSINEKNQVNFSGSWGGEASTEQEQEKLAQQFAEKLTSKGCSIKLQEKEYNNGEGTFTFVQILEGVPVSNAVLQVKVTADGVQRAEGTWLMGKLETLEEKRRTDSLSALLLYPVYSGEQKAERITGLEKAYCITVDTAGARVVPAYEMTDSAEKIWLVDAFYGTQLD